MVQEYIISQFIPHAESVFTLSLMCNNFVSDAMHAHKFLMRLMHLSASFIQPDQTPYAGEKANILAT